MRLNSWAQIEISTFGGFFSSFVLNLFQNQVPSCITYPRYRLKDLVRMSVHREKVDLAKLPHHYDGPVTLAVIGGTGLYDLPNLHPVARLTISTPWGSHQVQSLSPRLTWDSQ